MSDGPVSGPKRMDICSDPPSSSEYCVIDVTHKNGDRDSGNCLSITSLKLDGILTGLLECGPKMIRVKLKEEK